MQGIVNVLKPPGMTSHDVVAVLRRLFRTRRVGHTGTLDPGAAGVLPVCIGPATRLLQWMQQHSKAYRAEMTLGIETDTLDAAGRTTFVHDSFALPPARLADAFQRFRGRIEQVPPMVSSIKIGGQRLYDLARRGEVVERPPRSVSIDRLELVKVWPDEALYLELGTRVLIDVECSKGTYIRSLCADIGRELGCGAHMSFLVRFRSGPFNLEDAWTLEQIAEGVEAGDHQAIVQPAAVGVSHLTRIDVDARQVQQLQHGQALPWTGDEPPTGDVRLHGPGGDLIAMARFERHEQPRLQPVAVLGHSGGRVE